MQFSFEDVLLRILTTQTQHRCSGDIWIVDISGQEGAKGFRVLPCAAASSLVRQKFYPVYILKHLFVAQDTPGLNSMGSNGFGLSVAEEFNKLADKILIDIGFAKPERILKSLLDHGNIPVFTKDERYDKPIVGNPYLTIGPVKTHKSLVPPSADIRCDPTCGPGFFCE